MTSLWRSNLGELLHASSILDMHDEEGMGGVGGEGGGEGGEEEGGEGEGRWAGGRGTHTSMLSISFRFVGESNTLICESNTLICEALFRG